MVLAPHRLLPRFDFVLSADDIQFGKPHPEIYLKAAARWGCPPAEMLVLEDSINGLKAAKAAGARCVVVPHALVDRSALALADGVTESLESPLLYCWLGLDIA
jgi:beta-phosphoglucomutase-like phosphatase (HAD superfamily)